MRFISWVDAIAVYVTIITLIVLLDAHVAIQTQDTVRVATEVEW